MTAQGSAISFVLLCFSRQCVYNDAISQIPFPATRFAALGAFQQMLESKASTETSRT